MSVTLTVFNGALIVIITHQTADIGVIFLGNSRTHIPRRVTVCDRASVVISHQTASIGFGRGSGRTCFYIPRRVTVCDRASVVLSHQTTGIGIGTVIGNGRSHELSRLPY